MSNHVRKHLGIRAKRVKLSAPQTKHLLSQSDVLVRRYKFFHNRKKLFQLQETTNRIPYGAGNAISRKPQKITTKLAFMWILHSRKDDSLCIGTRWKLTVRYVSSIHIRIYNKIIMSPSYYFWANTNVYRTEGNLMMFRNSRLDCTTVATGIFRRKRPEIPLGKFPFRTMKYNRNTVKGKGKETLVLKGYCWVNTKF